MSLKDFGRDSDSGRMGRLVIGGITAVALVTGIIGGASLAAGAVKQQVAEKEVEVKFVEKVPEDEPPPEPEPEPEPPPPPQITPPKAKPVDAPPPPPPPPPSDVPTAIPTETHVGDVAPRNTAGVPGGVAGGVAGGVVGGTVGGTPGGTGTGPAAPPPPPKAKAIALPENADPPEAISKPNPPYPDAARTQGIEATIVVKCIVTETGDVIDCVIKKGHPLFDGAVLAAIKTWKFKPAMYEGKPLRVTRIFKMPFTLRGK